MGDLGGELPRRGESLASQQPALALLERLGHEVELAGELADLVLAERARGRDALGPVAAAELAYAFGQASQRSQGEEHADGGREPQRRHPEREPQREPLGAGLGDLDLAP
jgi:hypothetical protein